LPWIRRPPFKEAGQYFYQFFNVNAKIKMSIEQKRRNFLKFAGFFTFSTVGTVLAGCGGGGSDGVAFGPFPAGATPDSPLPTDPGYVPKEKGTYEFPNGIASGDPKSDSVVLWTRMAAVKGALGDQDLNAILQVATKPFDDASFRSSDIVIAHPIASHARYNYTVRHRIEGLQPSTHYWYRFLLDNDISAQGRTKTAPSAESTNPIQFAFISCQDWSANHWDTLRLLTNDDFDQLDFIVHLGDYIYETAADSAFQKSDAEPEHRNNAVDPRRLTGQQTDGTRYALALDDYRYLYAKYRSDPRILALHAKFPMIAIWDDHEFSDDCWLDHETYSDANTQQTERRRVANQAWFENMPVTMEDVAFAPDAANYDNIRIHRDFAFGKVMHLIMTDERLYRGDHAIPEPDGISALNEYLAKVIKEATDLTNPNGLYQFIKSTRVALVFSLESLLNQAINQGTLPLGLTIPGLDLATLKPTLLSLLNSILPEPLPDTTVLNIDFILSTLAKVDTSGLVAQLAAGVGLGGIGSRYAALGNILMKYVNQNALSRYSMLGEVQTNWWKQKMLDAQGAGTTWKIWGNEVSFLKMPLDINRIRNAGLKFSGALSILSGVIVGLIGVLKYLLTTDEVRAALVTPTDFSGDGSAAKTKPGQQIIAFADTWDGYPSARDELTAFLSANPVDNLIAITGDLHTFIAGQVKDRTSGQPVMLDFAGAGVSSNSFGGLISTAVSGFDDDSFLGGLKPLLTGRNMAAGTGSMLNELVEGISSRPDKTNNARDLLGRLLIHFSDEVQWAEGVANGFANVVLDMSKATITYHNLRVERDEAGLVQAPSAYATTADINSTYERRSHFVVYARNADTAGSEAGASVWPAFPERVEEYENPAVAGAPPIAAAARSATPIMKLATTGDTVQKLTDGVQAYVNQNPANPFARIFLDALQR
jgi:phosphodiesterase/alkaline phosphatase D-like protein